MNSSSFKKLFSVRSEIGSIGTSVTIALLMASLLISVSTIGVNSAPVTSVVGSNGFLIPHYFGPYPNYATSQLPVVTRAANGTVISVSGGIRKFINSLPGLGPAGANDLGVYIPVAAPDTTTYPGCDYYEIAVVEFRQKMHTDLPLTRLRGYVQLETAVNFGVSNHVPLTYLNSAPILRPNGTQYKAVDNPRYLGPLIVAQKDRPVRITFTNLLPKGMGGNLFLPVDTSVMGSGMGPLDMPGMPGMKENYTQNRATLHLHGGNTPWISDGTAHQWVTPAGEMTQYPKGVSVAYVPDMWFVNGEVIPNTVGQTTPPQMGATNNPGAGSLTFYYTNHQSARLLFYHDHSYGITRLNVYAGEAAGYLITDVYEQALVAAGIIPADQIPLIIQDKTFVPDNTTPFSNMWGNYGSQLDWQDPTWSRTVWGDTGDLWYPHVYMTMQNPGDPSGMNTFGRWQYSPWFWPPYIPVHGPTPNPYYNASNPNDPMEPLMIPGTPNPSMPGEAFLDTPVINGIAYPYLDVQPKAYRFRILSAADDRSWNLQLYVADSTVVTADGRINTEVKMVPAVLTAGYPGTWPTDGRLGGVPDPATAGPAFIQIGTEGGFLPAPAVLQNQPIDYNNDKGTFDYGLPALYTLMLAPAERADVVIDFAQFAGKTLILYNDCPAPSPAADPRQDYYTDNLDQQDVGGSPPTVAGFGPNTRTLMQIRVANATPAAPFDLTALNNAFASTSTTPGVFAASQNTIIVPQSSYSSAYNRTFTNVWGRIFDNSITFTPVDATTPLIIPTQPKSIHDEMGGSFEREYGRMSVQLGVEIPKSTPNTATTILYNFFDPPTEIVRPSLYGTQIGTLGDGVQIWKITHNGVDIHPVHWHMFDVQLINRVAWDNNVRPPDLNELGWKDTVRINPLQDTFVALRPIAPDVPFDIPNNIRLLDPTMPENVTLKEPGFIQDPSGNFISTTNHWVNFGWEFVWHCHILAHEEMDMMRVIAIAARPKAPISMSANITGNLARLTWTDNSVSETSFVVQRSTATTGPWSTVATVTSATGPARGASITYDDNSITVGSTYYYRVFARNVVGDTAVYATPSPGFPNAAADSAPSNIASTGTPIGDLFAAVRGSGVGEIYVKAYIQASASWTGWSTLPNGATSDTPAVAVASGREYFIVKGSDGNSLWFGSRNLGDGTFSGWTWIPGSTPSAPTLVAEGTMLVLVVRGGNNYVYFRTYDTVTQIWGNWQTLPAAMTGERPAAALINNKLHVVVRGMTANDTTLWYATVNLLGSDFSGWKTLSGSSPSAPVLTSMQTNSGMVLVVRGGDNSVYTNKYNGVAWQGWTIVPNGSTGASPAAGISGDLIHFVIVGVDGSTLWSGSMNLLTGIFSGWTPLSGSSPSPPAITRQ